jgi:hypothetical protein
VDRTEGRPRSCAWTWLGPAIALAFVVAPFLVFRGHVVDEEAVAFLRKYWDTDRGAIVKIFDVRGWDFYQGRELSYAIDYLDARWVGLVLRAGMLFFGAPSAVLASLALVLVVGRLAPRALPRLDAATRWLCLSLLLSNFVFLMTMGTLYRATKPLVAPLVLGLLLLALAEHRAPRLSARAAVLAAFATTVAMSGLDRQGLFYVLVAMAVLSITWLRGRRGGPLLAGMAAGVAAWYLYFRFVGPWLIQRLEGYWPSDRFQRLRPERLVALEPWREAVSILADWTTIVLGGLPIAAVAGAAALLALGWAWKERGSPRRLALGAVLAASGIVLQLAMVAIMVEHHPPVAWVSHRLWYYPLPYQAVLVFGLMWLLDGISARNAMGALPLAVPVALAGLVVLNVARWPEKRQEIATDAPFADQLRRSSLLVRSLEQGHAEPLLDGDHRRLYFDILDAFPRFGRRALSQVGEGEGVLVSEIRDGRVTAWAEQMAQIVARTAAAGRYVLAGRARLRSGERLQIVAGQPRRLVAVVERSADGEGDESFRAVLDLPHGANDIRLLSRLPEVRVPGMPRRTYAGYRLLLPVALWRDEKAATVDSSAELR